MPGAVATDISGNSGVGAPAEAASAEDSGFPTTPPENAARIIVDGIESGDFHIFVGRDARSMSLFSRLAPRRSTHLIHNKLKNLLPT